MFNILVVILIKDKERLLKTAREKKLVTRWLPDGMGEGENG